MKLLKILVGGVSLLALLSLGACSNDQPDANEPTNEYDDAYYASLASISCSDSSFTSSDAGGTVHFDTAGGSVVVSVDCGTDWTVDNHSSDLFTSSVNASAGTFTVTASQNTGNERTGSISVITASKRIEFATVTIVQTAYGAPEISVETSEWNFPAKGELTAEIGVECSLDDYSVAVNDDWVSYEKTSSGLKLTASANEDVRARSTVVTLTASDGIESSSATVAVSQDKAAYINLSAYELSYYEDASSHSVEVEANYDWDFSYDTSAGWYSVERSEDVLTVTVTDNTGSDSREGTVTVTASDGGENTATGVITVSQSAVDPTVMMFIYEVTNPSSSVMLPLSGTVDCTVDWGDGESDYDNFGSISHEYENAGTYKVRISGTVTALNSRYSYGSLKQLVEVRQWGKTGLTTMEEAFYNCSSLKSIPADEIGSFSEVTTFENAFRSCESLETVNKGVFDYATNVTTFSGVFMYCAMTSLPDGLFDNCSSVTDFMGVFDYCKSLKTLPDGLFKGHDNATDFSFICANCYALESLPGDLFEGCSEAQTFERTFEYCTSLKSIPAGLFASCTKADTFKQTFQGDSALTGESAYDLLTIDGSQVKVHLYERENEAYSSYYPDADISAMSCYSSCSGLDDYYSIPLLWGGKGE